MNPIDRPSYRNRLILLIVVFLLIAVLIFFWIRNRVAPEAEQVIRPMPVTTVRPMRRDLKNSLVLSAVLESENTAIIVPRVPGIVTEVLTEEGDRVFEGDLLARVDSEPYRLELQGTESSWLLAESRLERTRNLHDSAAVSLQKLEEAQAARDAALSTYQAAHMRRDYADIRASLSGTILTRYAAVGNMASVEIPLFIIGDTENLRIHLQVDEKYWDRFMNPEDIEIQIFRPDGDLSDLRSAWVERVSPGIDPLSKAFGVICTVAPSGDPWPVGSRLKVEIVLEERSNSWSLPLEALTGAGSVWEVQEEEYSVREIPVPQSFQDQERIEVPENWAGHLFVLQGHHRLREDGRVIVIEGNI